jgi:hypothetical protein
MLARRQSIWPALLFMAAIAALVLIATSIDLDRALPSRGTSPQPAEGTAALAGKIEARVCVTRHGICAGPVARVGDPCSCPNLLHGPVPGHVEILGAAPSRPGSTNWEDRGSPESSYDWDPLAGP